MALRNRQYRLAARPEGMVARSDFAFCEEPVRELADGEVLVKVIYVSLDPAMRGWMSDARSYIEPVAVGDVMRAGGAGRVVASRNGRFDAGDLVVGMFGVQEYAIGDGTRMDRVDPSSRRCRGTWARSACRG